MLRWLPEDVSPYGAGIDALFLEVHPRPSQAHSDRDTQLVLRRVPRLLRVLSEIRRSL